MASFSWLAAQDAPAEQPSRNADRLPAPALDEWLMPFDFLGEGNVHGENHCCPHAGALEFALRLPVLAASNMVKIEPKAIEQ